jgi:hypothetical protein
VINKAYFVFFLNIAQADLTHRPLNRLLKNEKKEVIVYGVTVVVVVL